jgi:hypothetical protein
MYVLENILEFKVNNRKFSVEVAAVCKSHVLYPGVELILQTGYPGSGLPEPFCHGEQG